jgi:hypothetical protein
MDNEMDINKDEMRRQLRDTQAAHDATLPGFAAALDMAFDPDAGVPAGDRAGLLGLPDRRGFLKIGGLSVALSAVAVACVYPDKEKTQLPATGTYIPAPSTSVAPYTGSPEVDATLVLTAVSLEKLAVKVYGAALEAGYLQLAVLQDVAKYFQSQHADHTGLLSAAAKKMGQNPDSVQPNTYLMQAVVQPALDTIAGEKDSKSAAQTDTLKLALALEDMAAQTYTMAGGLLTTPALRQSIMTIGPIEAKHYALLATALEQQAVPFSFEHTTGAVPEDAYISPKTGETVGTAPPAAAASK